ncbi:MAG: translation initiation factor IF-2 [Negativicutes bacterium]|jgi:translation initiation factor IF-2
MRIYDYAKKMEIENKLILEVLEKNGVSGKKSSNSLSIEEIKLLDGVFANASLNSTVTGTVTKTAAETSANEARPTQQPGAPVRRVTIGLDTKHRYDSRKILEINARLSNAHERQAVVTAQPPNMTREQREWQERQKNELQKLAGEIVNAEKSAEVQVRTSVSKQPATESSRIENTASSVQLPRQEQQREPQNPGIASTAVSPARPLYNHNPRPVDPNSTVVVKPGVQPGRIDYRPYNNNNNNNQAVDNRTSTGYQGGQRPNFQQGQRPPYQNSNNTTGNNTGYQSGARPSYQQGQRPAFGQNRPPFDKDKDGDAKPQYNNARRPAKPASSPDIAVLNKAPRKSNNIIDKNKKFGDKRDKRAENATKLDKHYRGRNQRTNYIQTAQKIDTRPKNIKILGSIAVNEFASKMGVTSSQVIMKLMKHGIMATLNQEIDLETAMVVGEDFGVTVEELPPEADPTEIVEIIDEPGDLIVRPPVVTVMGHVDHGKTSLLDAIRSTRVVAGEAGGITQHIGAYQVTCHGKKIAFLDTPGHEAFTAMRARGAQATDIAILVVAADDGVMPQTIEAINHAKAAGVPVIVAINKMDKDDANPERVKQQLTEYGLQAEDWGGETIMVPVSAQKRTGINELLEMILLVAEMNDYKANPNRPAQGLVIEAQLDKGRGPVATIMVQKGTLHIGDTIIAGSAYGNVRAMFNDRGERIKKAGPSVPVEILGLNNVPDAGDIILCVEEKIARAVADKRLAKRRLDDQRSTAKVSLEDLFKQIQEGNLKDLNVVVKADVQGSVEALKQSLEKITSEEVRVNIVHAAVGAITESDVNLAAAANAYIIGFSVRPDNNARKAAEEKSVDIRMYRVIYDAINDVEAAIKGMLAPQFKEVIQGKVEIRKVYDTSKGIFAGCYVLEGKVTNQSSVRLVRENIVLHEGKVDSLRRFKDDVKEVATGYECGIVLAKFREIHEGDVLEVFIMEEIAR